MRFPLILPITAVLAVLALPASASMAQTASAKSGMPEIENMSPFQKETMDAMDKMNKTMMQGMMDPDAGTAWMKSMAAHHQGAVEMSEIVLKHTKDADVTREARKTVQENEKSLKELQMMIGKENKKD